MTSFVKRATALCDVENDGTVVEVLYTRYVPGYGYAEFTDFFSTPALGDWTQIISRTQSVRYENFLNTMVEPNLEVRRRMATIALENIMCDDRKTHVYMDVMEATQILDNTFDAPVINMRCSWQKRFVNHFCTVFVPQIIETCKNEKRLKQFFAVMKTIEARL